MADHESVSVLIQESREMLKRQEKLVEENERLVQKIDFNKGIVLASTKDFQESCMSILTREHMLTRVVEEIELHLQHYKDYDECYAAINRSGTTDITSQELVEIMAKIEDGIEFFSVNFDFKKADVYLRRFESLKG